LGARSYESEDCAKTVPNHDEDGKHIETVGEGSRSRETSNGKEREGG